MRIQYIQHVDFETPGAISGWASGPGHQLTGSRLFEPGWSPDSLPHPRDIGLLVVMGGPMSVHDTGLYPWLTAEKVYLQACLQAGIPMLGICLGAQLIAEALGAQVFPASEKEIGWFPVQGLPAESAGRLQLPAEFVPLHWHGETFSLPPGTRRLASSPVCENQGFSLDDRVIGLQFHLEMQPDLLAGLIANSRHELAAAPWIQGEDEMLSRAPAACRAVEPLLHGVLDRLVQ
ncbi:MAG: type 1 glutamine amidotransferase [Spirochaeta sp.]